MAYFQNAAKSGLSPRHRRDTRSGTDTRQLRNSLEEDDPPSKVPQAGIAPPHFSCGRGSLRADTCCDTHSVRVAAKDGAGLDSTSTVLRSLTRGDDNPRVSLGTIAAGLRNRAFGLSVLTFALPCCVPMPPGVPTVCGLVIVLIALPMILGRERIWMPGRLARRSIERAALERMIDRTLPLVGRLERLCRPRLAAVTGTVGRMLLGLVLLVLGLILVLPIPMLGNLPPGIAAAVLGIGLSERNGVIVLAGLLLALAAIAITGAAAWGALLALASV